MATLADALDLAEAGWAVLPLRGKIPLTAHGVKDASTDPDQIRRWWQGAELNIGARVPSHLVVLDFDPQNGGTVALLEEAIMQPLPTTLTVHSGRGTGGQHRYFRRPPGSLTSTRLPSGIDVKTDRGYCVMPPSLHPSTGRPYTWQEAEPARLPSALIALLRPATPVRASRSRAAEASPQRLLQLAQFVTTRAEGGRNAALFWAACRALEEGHHDLDVLEGAALAAGLTEIETTRTIASAQRTVQR